MDIFGRKNNISRMVETYLQKVGKCISDFRSAITACLENGITQEFKVLIEKMHVSESLADDIRRELELTLYEKALIPESRGDILGLLESTDHVVTKAQSVLYQIETESLEIPEFLKEDISTLMHINADTFCHVMDAIRKLFEDIHSVRDLTREIDKEESASDRLERDIIRRIFSSDLDIGNKILLKELVIEIGEISDLSEVVGDRLNITAAKRLI